VLLFCGWAVKGLWNVLRRQFPLLPALSYGRALSLVVVWGLLFVVVLTMISGARELMTPGAWRKQGWTYKLADAAPTSASMARECRRHSDGGDTPSERLDCFWKGATWSRYRGISMGNH
jgi:hypothetical protein